MAPAAMNLVSKTKTKDVPVSARRHNKAEVVDEEVDLEVEPEFAIDHVKKKKKKKKKEDAKVNKNHKQLKGNSFSNKDEDSDGVDDNEESGSGSDFFSVDDDFLQGGSNEDEDEFESDIEDKVRAIHEERARQGKEADEEMLQLNDEFRLPTKEVSMKNKNIVVENKLLNEVAEGEQKQEAAGKIASQEEENVSKVVRKHGTNKRKKVAKVARGVCYLSRIPPNMDPVNLRHILSRFGEIERIFLQPTGPATTQVKPKKEGGFRGQKFSEGWVEFTSKIVAKSVANMLNGEQIGGKKRSQLYYDIWNIKYLSKFKWDDLAEDIAYKGFSREQKLALEVSAAKREKEFYLAKVDQSRALSSMQERTKKKQKVQRDSSSINPELPPPGQRVIRKFTQLKPVTDSVKQSKSRLSKDILAGVFGGSS